jgi:hypothetical protein
MIALAIVRAACGSTKGAPGGGTRTPLPFFGPGITIKGSLSVRFSDLTLKGT